MEKHDWSLYGKVRCGVCGRAMSCTKGKQFGMKEGIVHFQYKKMLGYRKGADGKPKIVPEEAETVR